MENETNRTGRVFLPNWGESAPMKVLRAEAEDRKCSGCDRIMSEREFVEQRVCNDCAA